MASQMTIDMELRFTDNATSQAKSASRAFDDIEKEAKEAGKQVDELGKKKAKPTVDADSSRADKKLSKLDSVLRKLGGKKTKTPIDADDKATAKIQKALNKAKEWAGKKFNAFLELKDSAALNSLSKVNSSIKKFAGKTWTTVVKIKDLATAPLRGIKNMLFSIKSLVLAITAGLAAKQLIANPIGLADAYSSAQIGFSTLLGESRGQQMMDDLDAFAKATPFKSSEVISQTQRMIAMGWDAENIIKDMTTIGDAAAATGKGEQGLQQIVTALAQIKTKGKLSTEELNQLAEAGISAKKYIAEGLGYGSGDEGIAAMTKDLENGAIASGAALEALLSGMQEYKGMMDKTANETVSGLWSQIEDTFEINIARRWGQGLQDGAKRSFGSIVELIDQADGALEEFGETVYEVGKNISNWLADKLENAVERVTEITDSFEFKNASLKDKISMLWKGVIADPFKEWFSEIWTNEENVEKATEFGKTFAENLTKGILGVLGLTDIFAETGEDAESTGSNIAQGFAKGFVDGFDASAITDKLVEAIGNVWGALPTWAQFLIGGYGIGKAAGGIASFAGGVANFIGGAKNIFGGFNIASSVLPHITSSGSGLLGTIGKTGVALGASTTGGALLAGSAGIAGGIAGGLSLGKGIYDLYGARQAYKRGDKIEYNAKMASGLTTTSGVAMGAAIGTAVGGPVGALVGAGIGGVAGWFMGGKAAEDIRAAKLEAEGYGEAWKEAETAEEKAAVEAKAKWENAKSHFGDIKLSMSEIQRMAKQVVWGDDLAAFEKYSTAAKQTEASFQSMKSAAEKTDRWMWKASLGVTFNEDEVKSIKESFDSYISSAKSYVENKHYEFTAAVELLVDIESEGGKAIIESGNAFYGKIQEELSTLETELNNTLDTVLADGVISTTDKVKVKIGGVEYELNEQEAISKLQAKINEITQKIAEAEQQAELETIKIKFGGGNLDYESFEGFMSEMNTILEERLSTNETALTASIANLKLQLSEGAITQDEYDSQFQTLVDGYEGKIESIKAEVMDVELGIVGEAYEDLLGEDAKAQLATGLQKAIKDGISSADVLELSDADLANLISISPEALENSGFSADNIRDMLSGVMSQIEQIQVDSDLLVQIGAVEVEGGGEEGDFGGIVKSQLNDSIPDEIEMAVNVGIKGEPQYLNNIEVLASEFGIETTKAETILFELSGKKTVAQQVDYIAKEFGINKTEAETILWELTGEKQIMNTISVTAGDFGIPDSIDKTVEVNITGVKKLRGGLVEGDFFRGGIVGGSGVEGFAHGGVADATDGGIVRGGARLVTVAEEGSPEMIIPLSNQRRDRALMLWAKAGEMLGVNKFARGGRTDGGADEGIRFFRYGGSDESAGGQSVQVNVGGVQVDIHVDAGVAENAAKSIQEQANEMAETVAGIFADAFGSMFENTPVRGGT